MTEIFLSFKILISSLSIARYDLSENISDNIFAIGSASVVNFMRPLHNK